MVVKTLGRETEETARFAAKAAELRDVNIKVGRIRAAFDPTLAALPNLGVLVVLAVGVTRVLSGPPSAGDVVTVAYLLTIVSFPIRSIGWLLGEFPRSVVGYRRVDAGAAAPPARWRTATAVRPPTAPRRSARGRRPGLRLRARPARLLDGRHLRRRARPHRGAGRRHRVRQEHAHHPAHPPGRPRPAAPSAIDGIDLRDLAPGELAEVLAVVPQTAFLFDDTVRGNVTLGADVTDDEVWAALRTAQADGFVARPAATASTPGSASAAPRCPAASGSGSRSPAPSYAGRGCWCSTTPPRAVDPEVEAPDPGRRCASGRQRADDAGRRRLPQGHHRPGRRGAPPRRRRDRRPRHRTPSCSPATRRTPGWSTPTSSRDHAPPTAEVTAHERRRPPRGAAPAPRWTPARTSAPGDHPPRRCDTQPELDRRHRGHAGAGRPRLRSARSSSPSPCSRPSTSGLSDPTAPDVAFTTRWRCSPAAWRSCSPAGRSYAMTARLFPPPSAAWPRCGSRPSATSTTCRC